MLPRCFFRCAVPSTTRWFCTVSGTAGKKEAHISTVSERSKRKRKVRGNEKRPLFHPASQHRSVRSKLPPRRRNGATQKKHIPPEGFSSVYRSRGKKVCVCVCVCERKEKGGRLIFGEARSRNEWGGGLSGYHPHLSRRPFVGPPKSPTLLFP